MTPIVPRVAIFSITNQKSFITSDEYDWIQKRFEIHFFNSPNVEDTISKGRYSLVVFTGPKLLWYKVKTFNVPVVYTDNLNGDFLYNCLIEKTIEDKNPKVSIFTPTYKTFDKFLRCYDSVIAQSFTDWEWIIIEDSIDTDNYSFLCSVAGNDPRIKIYKPNKNDGYVGSTKRQAASLCNGDYLLELDHDDELHHLALEYIVQAFKKYPDAGFCFSNSAEVFEDGGCVRYGDNFGMHFGKHYDTKYKGRPLVGVDVPINASTIRHIVGVPNHFRCWKREVYFNISRHNNKLPVVDDYEILIRTFLYTRMIHVREILYIQYMNSGGNNTQEPRRAEIQRLVDRIQKYYDRRIHERILELGSKDWLWNESTQESEIYKIPPKERINLAYVY